MNATPPYSATELYLYNFYRNNTNALLASTASSASVLLHGPSNIATPPLLIILIRFCPADAKFPKALHAQIVTSLTPFERTPTKAFNI